MARTAPGTKSPEDATPAVSSGLRSFAASAAERVRSLREEATRVVDGVRADAAAHAEDEESRNQHDSGERATLLREFGDTLADYATGLRRQCDDLLQILERVTDQLDPEASADLEREREVAAAAPLPEPTGERAKSGPSEGLRLLAAQMAAAGTPRPEIEARLRDEFGISNPSEALDEIFAP